MHEFAIEPRFCSGVLNFRRDYQGLVPHLAGQTQILFRQKKVIFRIPPPSDEANSTETFPVGHPGLQSTNLAPVRKPGLRGSSVPPETKKLLKLWKNPTPKTSGTGHSPSLEDSRETHHLPHVSMAL